MNMFGLQRDGLAEGLRIRAQIKLLRYTESSLEAFLSATFREETTLCMAESRGMPLGLFKLLLSEWLLAQHKPHVLAWPQLEEHCSHILGWWDLEIYIVQFSDLSLGTYVYQGVHIQPGQVWLRGIHEKASPNPVNA